MIKNFDVIGLGGSAIEQIVQLDRLPEINTRVICPPGNYNVFGSGVMGNTLTALTRLGMKTGYLGKLGGDHFGILLKQLCVNEGIDLSHCIILPHARSACNWIVLDKEGNRTSISFPNIQIQIDETYIHTNSYYLKSCRFLHVECSAIPLTSLLTAVEIAKSQGILIGLNLHISVTAMLDTLKVGTHDDLDELIFLSDLFMPCVEAAKELTNKAAPFEMARTLQELYQLPNVVISQNATGCCVVTPEEAFESPTFDLQVVDRTGADEAFQAGMIFGFLNEWDMQSTARFASACGAMNSLKIGSCSGMGSEEDVRQFMETH